MTHSALFEEFILEYQQVDNCHRDIGIGDVEYRTEEVVIGSNKEAEPRWAAIPLKEWQMNHINYLASEEACALRLDEEAIEHTIDHISDSTCQDKHSAKYHTLWHLLTLV
jgi:hypothetical protein